MLVLAMQFSRDGYAALVSMGVGKRYSDRLACATGAELDGDTT